MAMFDGKKKSPSSMRGGNVQREKFAEKSKSPSDKVAAPHEGEEPSDGKTTIEHHGDGTHTIHHADGETHEKVPTGAIGMHMHAKHDVGPAMHVHNHGGMPMHQHEGMEGHHTVTTHHVGHDGNVEGPHHHGSMDEAAEHMKSMIGEDGGNGALETASAEGPGETPQLY